jgi:hypothetical protein
MTVKQFLLLSNGLLALGFFIAATITDDRQKEQTRLLYAIWFTGWISYSDGGCYWYSRRRVPDSEVTNMKHISDDLIRKYLLGDVSEVECEQVEMAFLIDRDFHQRVDIVETELIDDFIDAELSDVETAKFLERQTRTPEQRSKIRIAAALKRGFSK